MGLFKRLAEKPWLVPVEGSVESLRSSEFSVHNRKVALMVFLAIIGVLFFLFFAAYHMRILLSTDWVAAPEPPLLWINTVVLIICSGAFEFSRNTARRGQLERTRTWFLIAGVLTLVFLVGQLIVWNQLIEYGYTAEKNPANAFFYLITGVHGAHLLGGLIAWIRAARKIREGVDPSVLRVSVELCAIYWHFLLFVWVVMLALFLNT